MFTDDQMKALFTAVMEQMVRARWLHSYMLTDGQSYHPTWTEHGTQRACLLKEIAGSFRLQGDDRAPVVFDPFAQMEPLPQRIGVHR